MFEEFDEKPIASGSVGQVYKAKYKDKKVAVKVRHPGIEKHIESDINLLFFFLYMNLPRFIVNDYAPKAAISNQDIGAQP